MTLTIENGKDANEKILFKKDIINPKAGIVLLSSDLQESLSDSVSKSRLDPIYAWIDTALNQLPITETRYCIP